MSTNIHTDNTISGIISQFQVAQNYEQNVNNTVTICHNTTWYSEAVTTILYHNHNLPHQHSTTTTIYQLYHNYTREVSQQCDRENVSQQYNREELSQKYNREELSQRHAIMSTPSSCPRLHPVYLAFISRSTLRSSTCRKKQSRQHNAS